MHGLAGRRALLLSFFLLVITAFTAWPRTASAQQYGLEWTGDGNVRRMLFWTNPFPIYDATYIFKVYPRKKTVSQHGPYLYWTTFFWGNDGPFTWGSGSCNSYYGAHPYPEPAPAGPQQWEISVNCNDYLNGTQVVWDRWYQQAFRAYRDAQGRTHHEFYYDWPDQSKRVEKTVDWAPVNPPRPIISMGQSAWGSYDGDEEFNGIIRGIQIYAGNLSPNDIGAEIAQPLSTTAGRNFIWYLNLNPRPSDTTDKKGIGTPHNPQWRGTTALEWTDGGSSPPPPPGPQISGVNATSITSSGATIVWTTNEASDSQVEYGTTTAYGQSTSINPAMVTSHSMSLSSLAASTTYHYRVRSRNAAGITTTSGDFSFATSSAADTTPPAISGVNTTNVTTSAATVRWTTNENSDSQVDYGTTTAYGQSTGLNGSMVTSHSMGLSGLAGGTTYHYRVRSRDGAGNLATSSDVTFATAAAGDTTPPTISAVTVTNVTSSGATVSWTTNEASDSQVDYGTTASYGQTTPNNPSLVTAHSVAVSGLSASTSYHFRVRSRDAAGNTGLGSDSTFTTSAAGGGGATPLASYGFNEATGSATVDASGHGFNGILLNGPVWTSGRNGNALLFDGVNDKVSLPSSLDIPQLPFTFEAWINPTSRADWRAIFSKRSAFSPSQLRFNIGLEISSGVVYVSSYNTFVRFSYAPPLNAWTHLAVVADSSGTKLYANGVLKQTLGAVVLGSKANALVAIGNSGDEDDPFAGTIDDVRIYTRALSVSEIQTDMNAGIF
jgi:hypothetical protein